MSKKGKKSGGKRTAAEPETAASMQPPPPIAALDINEDGGWTSFPVLLHTSQPYSTKYVEQALAAARKGRRRRFHVATRTDIEQLVKESAKGKGKSKDPSQAAVMEACGNALENGVLTARGAALVVATKMLAAKKAALEKRQQEEAAKQAALSAPKAGESGSRSKTPKAGKKKGKGGAGQEDAPGKKKSALKSRKEEAAMIDFIDDEPSDGPDQYWLLHGFSDPDFVTHMCDAGACIRALVDTTTEDDEEDEQRQEAGKEEGEKQRDASGDAAKGADNDFKTETPAKDGQAEEPAKQPDTFVDRARALCFKADRSSQLNDIAWLSLDIGRAPAAEESFNRIANLTYDVLSRHRQYKAYLASLHTYPFPDPVPRERVPHSVYNALLSAVDVEAVPIALMMDSMLRQVEATVAASAPETRVQSAAPDGRVGSGEAEPQTAPSTARTRSASAMTNTEERQEAEPLLAGFLDTQLQGVRTIDAAIGGDTSIMEDSLMPAESCEGGGGGAGEAPLVLRHGDRLSAALELTRSSRYNAQAAAMSVLDASQAAHLLRDRFPALTHAAAAAKKLKRQQLLKFASSSPPQTERFVFLSAMQVMLSHATGTPEDAWDLSAWSVTERLQHACLLQHLNEDMQQRLLRPTLHYFDDMDCLLIAMHRIPDPEAAGPTTDAWEHLIHTKIGFTDFLEHTAQWLATHEPRPERASAGSPASTQHAEDEEEKQLQQQQEPHRVGYDYPRKLLRISGRTDALDDGQGTVVHVCETGAVHSSSTRYWALRRDDVGVTLHEHARSSHGPKAASAAAAGAATATAPSANTMDATAPGAGDTIARSDGNGGGDQDGADGEGAGAGHSLVLTVGETIVSVSERVVEALRTRGRSEWTPPPPTSEDADVQDQQAQDGTSLAAVPESARPESSAGEKSRKKGDRPRSRRDGAGSTAKSVRIRQPDAQQSDAALGAASTSGDDGSGGPGADAGADEANAAAEAAAAAAKKAREFQPQPLESLFTLCVGTAGGVQLGLLPTGEVVMLNSAAAVADDGGGAAGAESQSRDASETEISRTLMPGGYVARHMANGRVMLLCPDGTTFDNVASETEWDAVRFDGTRTRVRGNPPAAQSREDVLVVRRVSVPERVAVQTREDNATLVGELDRDHAAEYSDGTRILTHWVSSTEKLVRVECMGHPPVELRDNGASVVVLENGATALVHHGGAGTLQVCSPRRGVDVLLRATGEGTVCSKVPSQLNNDGRGVYDAVSQWEQRAAKATAAAAAAGAQRPCTHRFDFITGEYEGTDALGSVLRVRDMEALVEASDEALLAPLSARFPPRLYVVHRNGTGERFLREADVAAYDQAAAADADVRCVETELYDDPGTISKTYIKRERPQNKFLAHYGEASLLPVSMQRTRLPHHDYDRPGQLLFVRQLQFHATAGAQEQAAMQHDLDRYNEWLAKQDAAAEALHVQDLRSAQEKETANALAQDLQLQLTAMEDEAVSEGCETLTAPSPKPVAKTTGRATLDQFFAEDEDASGSITEMKAMLQSRTIPDYFASPEAAAVRQRLEAHAAELHRAAADADGGGGRESSKQRRQQGVREESGDGSGGGGDRESRAAADEVVFKPRGDGQQHGAGGEEQSEDKQRAAAQRQGAEARSSDGVEAAAASLSESIDELASQRESMNMDSPEPLSPSKMYASALEAGDDAEAASSSVFEKRRGSPVLTTVQPVDSAQPAGPSREAQRGDGTGAHEEEAETPGLLHSTLPRGDVESSPVLGEGVGSPTPSTQGPLSPKLPINAVAQKTRAFDFLRDRGSDQPQVVRATPSALTDANADDAAIPEDQLQQQQQMPTHAQKEVETQESPQPLVGRRASTGSSRPGSGRALPEVRVRSAQTLRSNVPQELRQAQQRPALAEVVPSSLARPDPLPGIGQQGHRVKAPSHTSQISPPSLEQPRVEAVPAKAEFGTLKGGCTYCLVVKLYNRGTTPCDVELRPVPVDSGLDVTCLADKISPGMSVKVTLHVDTARALGPRAQQELREAVIIVCDGTEVVLPVMGMVLSLKDFEAQKATSRSRGPGVRLVAARTSRA